MSTDHDTTTTTADIVRAIAAHLPDGWQDVDAPHSHGARITADTGVTLWVRRGSYGPDARRLSWSVGSPDGATYSAGDFHGVDSPTITTAADRDPVTVARDVTRRLLPDAIRVWGEVSGRVAQRVAAASARDRLARELAELMGGSVVDRRGDVHADTPNRLRNGSRYVYGSMTPDHNAESVTVELRNVSPDRARAIARMVAEWADDPA